jgi:heavy metal translocating P-type ATPase
MKEQNRMNPCRVETVHALAGRVRIWIQGLKGNHHYASSLERTIKRNANILYIKANSQTGKALIIFDQRKITHHQVSLEINKAISHILQVVAPAQFKRSRSGPQARGKDISNNIFEPEDLPLKTQLAQVIGGGTVILLLLLARVLKGRILWLYSPQLNTIAAVTSLITGYPIFRSGIENYLKAKKLNNDFLISSATIASLVLREGITGLAVIWLVNLSTLFQTLTLDKSRKAIKDMLQGKQESAWLEIDGTVISIPIEDVQVGSTVVCYLGEKIPVDGKVTAGEATVNQAVITGESVPVLKNKDTQVFAGSIVEQGTIKVLAEKVGKETSLARIIHMVEEASESRAPIQNIADRYAEKLVPLSFLLAAFVFVITRDFKRSMTMLIVACPCAAGLATPTALSAAMGSAAAQGILIKGGNYLEKVGETNVILFDKTGTLTEGKPVVTEVLVVNQNYTAADIVQLAASVEAQINHPLAKALVKKAEEMNVPLLELDSKEITVGLGVKAIANNIADNTEILIGNKKFMEDNHINLYRGRVKANRLSFLGRTVLYVSKDRQLIGILGIADKIRTESKNAIKKLRESGIETIGLITGDSPETAELVGAELGVDRIWASALPEDKVKIVQGYQQNNQVVTMVGEGINDSPALCKADVGIAMGTGGTDVAIESADVVLAGDDPEKIPELIRLSNKTMEVIRQNFTFAVGINTLGLLLGAGKFISPLVAAVLHNLSTFGVVVNSIRLLGFQFAPRKGRKRIGRAKKAGR